MLNDKPDGTNINKDCGSTHIEGLQKAVIENHCDVGLAFDGDADRCLAVDENGELIDGDKLMAIFSLYMKELGLLKSNTCVVTVMTNLGFFKFAKKNNVVVTTTKVGDRYVLEEMQRGGYNLGGEQSGHIIMLDFANTGDGELTGTKLLTVMSYTKKRASELAACMETYPQILVNVTITPDKKGKWETDEAVQAAIKKYTEKLGNDGRILVRESGTEPLVRVMIEGKMTGVITEYANDIARLIEEMK
jgi:phosphoglucosamine mutase